MRACPTCWSPRKSKRGFSCGSKYNENGCLVETTTCLKRKNKRLESVGDRRREVALGVAATLRICGEEYATTLPDELLAVLGAAVERLETSDE